MKKILFGLLVSTASFGASLASLPAFKNQPSEELMPKWFRYHGGPPSDGNSYTITVSMPTSCPGGANLCAILAEEDPENQGHPIVESQTDVVFHE